MIEEEIIPHLPKRKRGLKPKVPLYELINSILCKLKTGIQWKFLPVKQLFSGYIPSYKTIFGHYQKWGKEGVWRTCWIAILKKNKSNIDLSSCDFDGSQTPAKKGGEQVDYQKRKRAKTTNSLYLSDRQGLLLAMSNPISGNHHDLFDIEIHFEEVTSILDEAKISIEGLFMNFDSGLIVKNYETL